jgi:hypothetical protein
METNLELFVSLMLNSTVGTSPLSGRVIVGDDPVADRTRFHMSKIAKQRRRITTEPRLKATREEWADR